MHRQATWIIGICGVLAAVLTGCGGASQLEVATVHGRVTCDGKPVPGGEIRLVFVPAADPSATVAAESPPEARGQIDENGNFTLSTYATGDGAVLGKHQVLFRAPVGPEEIKEAQEALEELEDDPEDDDHAERVAKMKADIELSKKLAELGDTLEPGEVTVVTGDNEFDFKLVKEDEEDN